MDVVNFNHVHFDAGDLLSIFVTLGVDITGGSTVYYDGTKPDEPGDVVLRIPHEHGRYQITQFDKILHCGTPWRGKRGIIQLYLSKNILQHFRKYGLQFYKEMQKLEFPSKYIVDNSTRRKYLLSLKKQKDRYQEKKKRMKELAALHVVCRRKGGFVDVGRDKATGNWLRTCVHDAFVNAAKCLGIELDAQDLYEKVRPKKIADVSLGDVAVHVKDQVRLVRCTDPYIKGGPELTLLRKVDCGIFIVLCNVTNTMTTPTGAKLSVTRHAFVYDSGAVDEGAPGAKGAVIDNRLSSGVRMVEESDRAGKEEARLLFNDFFMGLTNVTQMVQIVPVAAKAGGA